MGGFGSGRQFGRPIVEASAVIDLAWMLRTGWAKPNAVLAGCLSWASRGQPLCQVDYMAHMATPGAERLELSYAGGVVQQTVRLCHTTPNYGGKRWWIICPYRGARVNKLYLPPGGDRFASRQVWRLGYRSERSTEQARALDRLFALQRRLGCPEGLSVFPKRPKRMWQRTYERHLQRYWELQDAAHSEVLSSASRFMV